MDTLKSEKQEDYYGLFHESFSPLPIHVDTGFDSNAIIYKQVVTPLSSIGDTIFFKKGGMENPLLLQLMKKN